MKSSSSTAATTIIVALLALACASNNKPRPCEPVPIEFFKAGGPVYSRCEVDTGVRHPGTGSMPRGFQPTQACGRVSIEVVIDTTGFPIIETSKVTRSNDSQLEIAVMQSLTGMRFRPAIKNGAKVRQLTSVGAGYTMRVVAPGTPSAGALMQAPNC